MKYRVRLDLPFVDEGAARSLMAYAKQLSNKAVSINEGQDNEEIAFCDLEICYHDDPTVNGKYPLGKCCERLERAEIRSKKISKYI